jgi:hypothetical protein
MVFESTYCTLGGVGAMFFWWHTLKSDVILGEGVF